MKNSELERYHPIKLPGLTIPGNLFLAPLAGITNQAFRRICLEEGAPFTFSEMISAEAVARGNAKTLKMLQPTEKETYFGVQIFLSNPDQALRCLPFLEEAKPSLIDVNCGCPVPKVVKTGSGAALMRNPKTIGAIVSALVKNSSLPITVKIRTGWDNSEITYRDAAKSAIDSGAVMVTLHGRTRAQGYSGFADWKAIADLVQHVTVPVIGNGDLFTPEAAASMLEETGCAGVMFARGAMANPSIFRQTKELLTQDCYSEVLDPKTILERGLRHLQYAIQEKGEYTASREMRKQMVLYTKGLPDSAALRRELVGCENEAEYTRCIQNYLELHV